MEFPVVHTNIWDGTIAVPVIVILTQCSKLLPIPSKYYPTIASILGFGISIFISHRGHLWAGLFMGSFYSAAAVGTYASLKTAWIAFRKKRAKKHRVVT